MLDHGRVLAGLIPGHANRALRRRHRGRLDVVFHENRHAVQGADEAAGVAHARIEFISAFECLRVRRHHRVQGRPALIIGADSRKIGFGNAARRRIAVTQRGLRLRDAGFLDRKPGT